jgi:ribosomal-protein-alanine N-acetyltransferase
MSVRYVVRPMMLADIPRVTEIERLAYPTPWPTSAYRKELQDNPLAHYIVARDTQLRLVAPAAPPSDSAPRRPFPLSLLPTRTTPAPMPDLASLIGFAGLWLMVDEAHITTIAVHPDYRRRSVGELMLSVLIQIAYDIRARHVTLEVRISNTVAQNLYHKYGFREAGIRRRYYSDNHEDAIIMWTNDITTSEYRADYDRLRTALFARLQAQDPE